MVISEEEFKRTVVETVIEILEEEREKVNQEITNIENQYRDFILQ